MKGKSWLLAAAAGAFLVLLAYPPFDQSRLAWFALLPLLWLARRRRPFPVGLVAGLVFFGSGLFWLTSLSVVGWVLLTVYLAFYAALFFSLATFFNPRFFALKLACAGVSLEYLAGTLFSGFPWFCIAHTQYRNEFLLGFAPLGGAWLISGIIYLVNGTLFSCLVLRARKDILPSLLVGALLFSWLGLYRRPPVATPSGATMPVSLVQANVPSVLRAGGPVLEPYLRLTATLGRKDSGLIVWPETTFAAWSARAPDDVLEILGQMGGAYLLSGVLEGVAEDESRERWYNSAALYCPERGVLAGIYRKRHLVPFGEFIPGRRFGIVRRMVERDAGFLPFISPGSEAVSLGIDRLPLVPLICYESVFSGLAARSVYRPAEGPRLAAGLNFAPVMVVLTNDSWLGRAGGAQHFAAATFRAAENEAWLLRAANTGVTAVIDHRGRIISRLPVDRPGILRFNLPLSPPARGPNLFQRRPRLFPHISLAMLSLFLSGEVFRFLKTGKTDRQVVKRQQGA